MQTDHSHQAQIPSQALLEVLPVAAWQKDLQARYVWVNPVYAQHLGLSVADLLGRSDEEVLPDWMCESIQLEEMSVFAGQQARWADLTLPKVEGAVKTLRCYRTAALNDTGELNGILGFGIDVSTEKNLYKTLQTQIDSQSSWLRALQDHALISMMDRQGRFTYVSDQFGRLIGQPAKAMVGQARAAYKLQPEGMQIGYYLTLAEQGTPVSLEYSGFRPDESPYWGRSLLIALKSAADTEQVFFELATDLTAEKMTANALNSVNDNLIELINKNTELIAQLEVAARTDPLTGLLNRRALYERAKQEGDRAKRKKSPLSLIAMDVDHFKMINDQYGHEVGDQALIMLARWCGEALRSTDLLARTGGEEFILLLPDTDLTHAMLIAERMRLAIQNNRVLVESSNTRFGYTVSQGVAMVGEQESVQDAMIRADRALYQAKAEGRNRVCQATI